MVCCTCSAAAQPQETSQASILDGLQTNLPAAILGLTCVPGKEQQTNARANKFSTWHQEDTTGKYTSTHV
eukprot:5240737-Amphidinium_carterae.1